MLLSYGRKRALEIATTLALEPKMLLLDEPTAGMTHEDVDRIVALIRRIRAGRTILMVEHNLSVVEGLCDRITVLARGQILAEGDYASVSKNPDVVTAYLGTARCLNRCSDQGLNAWYGESHILHGVDFDVNEGEVVTLLGRNGAGKTTTMKSIMGLVPQRAGSIRFKGAETVRMAPDGVARAGIAFCPEERGIFASLNVTENLMLPPQIAPGGMIGGRDPHPVPEPQGARRAARAPSCPAASSRCWRSAASCAPAPGCCCSTSRPRASPR